MKLDARINGQDHVLEIDVDGRSFLLTVDGREIRGDVRSPQPGVFTFYVGARVVEARVSEMATDDTVRVQIGAHSAEIRVIDRKRRRAGAHSGGEGEQTLCAPMPGKVVAILASVGDAVDVGQGVVVVEAMKMQNEVKAAMAGVVADIRVGIGDTVNAGQVLGTIA